MSPKNSLVATKEKIYKEGINEMKTKPNVVDKAITCSIGGNKLHRQQKKDRKHLKVKKINP